MKKVSLFLLLILVSGFATATVNSGTGAPEEVGVWDAVLGWIMNVLPL